MSRERRRYFGRGLDVGTSFVRCAEMQGQEIVSRSERSAFIDLNQAADFTEGMLGMAQLDYAKTGDQLRIVGTKAIEFANISQTDARRPLRTGLISPSEDEALPMMELIVRNVAGEARQGGEPLYFSVPGEPLDAEVNLAYHEKTISGILRKLGYNAKPINEGLAVVFSELAEQQFTGIGMSFGGGMVNVGFAYRSLPLLTFSLARGGDWIDEKAALALSESSSQVCLLKESSLDLSKGEDGSNAHNALSIAYDELIGYAADAMKDEVSKMVAVSSMKDPLPIVLSGGTAAPRGFAERFTAALKQRDFPLEIARVQVARDPFGAVAKGALTAARVEGGRLEESEAGTA